MTIRQSNWALGKIAIPYAHYSGETIGQRFFIDVTAAQLVLNDIFEIAPIPVGHVPLGLVLDSDDLDSNGAPLISFDVGIMSGVWGDADQSRTIGNEFLAGSTIGRTGGVDRPTKASAFRIAAVQQARSIGVKIAAAPATAVAGQIGLTIHYAPQI